MDFDEKDKDPKPDSGSAPEGQPIDDRQLVRIYKKLDRRIIPALWVTYFLISAVRANVGLALTMNTAQGHSLSQNLSLSNHQVAVGVALFYVGYVVFELPFTILMTVLAPQAWLARIVFTVGIIAACHGALSAAWNFYLLRLLLGIAEAGLWPGFTYYIMLFYPPTRAAKLIGWYFTAAQLSAAVVGLVSAGFQEMDGDRGLTGYAWMFLIWGVITIADAIALLWWLPARPRSLAEASGHSKWNFFIPTPVSPLEEEEERLHYQDLSRVNRSVRWTMYDLARILMDWRSWPFIIMYFGVVGAGNAVTSYGTLIIEATNPSLSSIDISLLFAPIWIMDGISILLITPLSDKFHRHRAAFFSFSCTIIIVGLLVTSFATYPWPRYVGLLLVGFGLGPTVPICMAWSAEVFQERYGDVGVAAAAGLVSGLGNLGSVATTYALYSGWASDAARGYGYQDSNLIMIGILGVSIICAIFVQFALARPHKR